MSVVFSPADNQVWQVYLTQVDPDTGVTSPAISGGFQGFIALLPGSTGAAADPSLSVAGVYIGGAGAISFADNDSQPGPGVAGSWQFLILGSALTPALCATLFRDGNPYYFIVTQSGAVRAVQRIIFRDSLFMLSA